MFILPICTTIFLFVIISLFYNRKASADPWFCAIAAITASTLYVFICVELFSLFHILGFRSILISWLILLGAEAAVFYICFLKKGVGREEIGQVIHFPKIRLLSLNSITAFFCVSAVVFALIQVPNNYDGMSYHLPRMVHWLQNRSVAHYACHDISQISDPYLAEFVNISVYLLSGSSDRFLNLLQAFSYIITILLIYKICVKIGCAELWASLSCLVYAMSPIVFGEALNVQVDIYAGLWLMFFVYLSLWFIESDKLIWNRETFVRIMLMGLICGFAYAAKSSVLFGVLTFAAWLVIRCLVRKDNFQHIILCGVGIIAVAGIIILPELARNIITFGSFAAEESSTHFLIPAFTPRYFLYNLLLNLVYNLPNSLLNTQRLLNKVVVHARGILFPGEEYPEGLRKFRFLKNPSVMNHDSALNSLVMWLFLLALLIVVCVSVYCAVRKKRNPILGEQLGVYWIPAFSAFLIFLGIVGWYPYINRYEVSYYSLVLPGIAYVLQKVFSGKRSKFAGYAVITVSVLTVFYFAGLMYKYQINHIRQGKTRTQEYFRYRDMSESYGKLTEYINENGFTQLGFICGNSSYEYPFWIMTEKPGRRVEHVNVTNETARYADLNFHPECIFATDVDFEQKITCNGQKYAVFLETEDAVLYIPA